MDNVNIVFARVDNRLVHGQVGMVWANKAGANLVLVVDDEAANDKIQQQLMKMTLSTTGIGIRFWSVSQTIENIGRANPNQKIFIVTKTPHEMRALVDAGLPIKAVNLGNMHSGLGKRQFKNPYCYVDDKDEEDIYAMVKKGVRVSIQVLPDYREIIVD